MTTDGDQKRSEFVEMKAMRDDFLRACRFFFNEYSERDVWVEKVFANDSRSKNLLMDFTEQWFKGQMLEDVTGELEYLASATGLLVVVQIYSGSSFVKHDIPEGSILSLGFFDFELTLQQTSRTFYPAHSGMNAMGDWSVVPPKFIDNDNCFKGRG